MKYQTPIYVFTGAFFGILLFAITLSALSTGPLPESYRLAIVVWMLITGLPVLVMSILQYLELKRNIKALQKMAQESVARTMRILEEHPVK